VLSLSLSLSLFFMKDFVKELNCRIPCHAECDRLNVFKRELKEYIRRTIFLVILIDAIINTSLFYFIFCGFVFHPVHSVFFILYFITAVKAIR